MARAALSFATYDRDDISDRVDWSEDGPAVTRPKRRRRNLSTSKAAPNPRAPKCPRGMEVQTLVFPKSRFTAARAREWAKSHGFEHRGADKTKGSTRIRQYAPSRYEKGSFRTIPFGGSGVKAVIGCPLKSRANPCSTYGADRPLPKRVQTVKQRGVKLEGSKVVKPRAKRSTSSSSKASSSSKRASSKRKAPKRRTR